MQKNIILVLVLVAIFGSIYYLNSQKAETGNSGQSAENNIKIASMAKEDKAKMYEPAKEISSPDAFINSDPFEISDLIGKKVILVDFWTYSCINCQRTLPYLNAWYDKYKDKGLEIVGIHTPEFDFEKEYTNVVEAVKKFDIKYPVVMDNDFSTWHSYNNRYWPRKYLIDIDGYIIYDHIGEGGYDETEQKIQEALKERATVLGMQNGISGKADVKTEDMDLSKIDSPETYFGSARNVYLENGEQGKNGIQNFTLPKNISKNKLYLSGTWDIKDEYAKNTSANAGITFKYDSKNVYFVASSEKEVKIKVYKDGVFEKEITVKDSGLYHVIEGSDYSQHTLNIIIESPGLEAFTFTFG